MLTTQEFRSIKEKSDFGCHNLQLKLVCFNKNALEVELTNLRFNKQRSSIVKKLTLLISCYVVYKTLDVILGVNLVGTALEVNWTKVTLIDLTFVCLILSLISSTLQLVRSEKLLVCKDFGLQLQILWFLSRKSSMFIPSSHIYDVCINEVIEDLDIHYILILRTKGNLFYKKPIIPIFNTLKPEVSCLEEVYKYLNKALNKEQDFID